MRSFRTSLMCCLSLMLAAAPALVTADDKATDGWISLFNGKDLTGWKASEKVEWKVVDGLIVTPPQRSHLFTDAEYKNFEFKADVMTTPGSNSGIYFHTKYEDTFPNNGIECQVNLTHTDPVKSGSLYFIVKRFEAPAKDNEWYTQHIIVKGKAVTVKINDKVLYEYVEPDGVTGTRRIGKGSFALQAHDPKSVVKYRNIMVKPLAD
ncbi:MAG TPA: DUF1080 domain-containing protein [Planctomycetaceae bacterium]|jgi:hypothetical protein|nr:DUF1080 domain-containing protein [Planctomycetaceae bacterium]